MRVRIRLRVRLRVWAWLRVRSQWSGSGELRRLQQPRALALGQLEHERHADHDLGLDEVVAAGQHAHRHAVASLDAAPRLGVARGLVALAKHLALLLPRREPHHGRAPLPHQRGQRLALHLVDGAVGLADELEEHRGELAHCEARAARDGSLHELERRGRLDAL
jgi:hypothetical protein